MRTIENFIIHCSATPEGRDVTVDTIRRWHLKRGWSDVGYHFICLLDGTIKKGRPQEKIGAHTKGKNNHSIGICYIGGMDENMEHSKDTRTEAQKKSLVRLLLNLKSEHCDAVVNSHKDFSNKACPSFDATKEYKWISDYYEQDT
tara:strand:- start:2848 stop:3282 length:435 start_codon:yes stop_codon:yes gene_type:complete